MGLVSARQRDDVKAPRDLRGEGQAALDKTSNGVEKLFVGGAVDGHVLCSHPAFSGVQRSVFAFVLKVE